MSVAAEYILPSSVLREGLLVGRVWRPGPDAGPSVTLFDAGGVYDISHLAPTMSQLLEHPQLTTVLREMPRRASLCSVRALVESSHSLDRRDTTVPHLLAPCDLQAVKACGVTFAVSALERVVEERTRGNPDLAAAARRAITESLGGDLTHVRPGSPASAELKQRLVKLEMWSQYLEVALGPDAEIFTKASPLSAVGIGAEVGIHRMSRWNNPEPEVVLAVNSRGETVGASLGNDVNLRDVEGRSALLLGKAKDNNGACAIGPAIRLFDERFSIDQIRSLEMTLEVDGLDRFHLKETSFMRQISRDPLDLVAQAIGPHHQYPDGLMLFLGAMFAPTQDRGVPGLGFTHCVGDTVTISAKGIGSLVNTVNYCDAIPPWTFGIGELFKNLKRRGLW